MKNKYFILVFTFLCLFVGQRSYSQDWQDMGWDDATNDFVQDYEDNGGTVDYYDNAQDYADAVNNDDDPNNDYDSGDYNDNNYNDSDNSNDNQENTGVVFWVDPGTGISMMYDGEGRTYADLPPFNDGIFQRNEVVHYDPNWADHASGTPTDSSNDNNNDSTDIYDGLLDTHNYDNDTGGSDDDQYPYPDDTNNNDDTQTNDTPTPDAPATRRAWYLDNDGDGYYISYVVVINKPDGNYTATTRGVDCDDNNYSKNLGTDCGWKIWYLDEDKDQYHSDETEQADFPGIGWVLSTKGVDCEESDPEITDQCRRQTWYFDWDGDEYHSSERVTGDYPGDGWVLTTKGVDCDDIAPRITTQCRPSTCKGCPEVTTPAVVVDFVLPGQTADYGYVDTQGVVHIKSEDGTYKKPSELNPNSDVDRTALHQIAASLARSLDGMNKNIEINSTKGKRLASENPAFTRTPPGTLIFLNSNGGFSKSLNNVNDFKSILKHEIFHVDDNIYQKTHPTFVPKNYLEVHADVYIKQAKDPSYVKTTLDFRNGNAGSFANYLLNMDISPDATITRDVIAKKIAAFNESSPDVKVRIADLYSQKGGLDLKLEIKGKLTDYVKMQPETI